LKSSKTGVSSRIASLASLRPDRSALWPRSAHRRGLRRAYVDACSARLTCQVCRPCTGPRLLIQ
jgi:hypothetical protein